MSLFEKTIPLFLKNKKIAKTNLVPIDNIEKIFCFSNTAIGDTLFNTPIFRNLKKNLPNKKIIAILNPNNYTLFETNPYIDEILLYDGKTKNFLNFLIKLKKMEPTLIMLLHSNEPQATPISVLSGAKYILKSPNSKNSFNLWHTNPPIASDPTKHIIYTRLKLLNYLGIKKYDCKMDLFLKPEWNNEVKKYINKQNQKLIGFQIGASTISRMWFIDKWIELGKKLLNYYPNINIILTGSKHEQYLTNQVEKRLRHKRVLNMAGKLSLGAAAALIDKLDLLITPDTGPLHIAAALKTPTIALYGVMNHRHTNPCFDEDIHIAIQKEIVCEPCIKKKCNNPVCMSHTPEEIIQKIKTLNIF